jgi:hypothetical protein
VNILAEAVERTCDAYQLVVRTLVNILGYDRRIVIWREAKSQACKLIRDSVGSFRDDGHGVVGDIVGKCLALYTFAWSDCNCDNGGPVSAFCVRLMMLRVPVRCSEPLSSLE